MPEKITLELGVQKVDIILAALAAHKESWNVINPIIDEIMQQAKPQMEKAKEPGADVPAGSPKAKKAAK